MGVLASQVKAILPYFLAVCGVIVCGLGAADARDYRLKSGDVVGITVLEDQSLNRQLLVRPDGKVSMPIAGTLTAGGRTLEQLQAEIQARLRPSFQTLPNVTASLVLLAPPPVVIPEPEPEPEVEEIILWSVYVLGEVQRPGRFEYEPESPITVLQALALAGGPSVFAARSRIQIRQSTDGKETVTLFDYGALEDDGITVASQELTDGSVILVPERGLFD